MIYPDETLARIGDLVRIGADVGVLVNLTDFEGVWFGEVAVTRIEEVPPGIPEPDGYWFDRLWRPPGVHIAHYLEGDVPRARLVRQAICWGALASMVPLR